MCLWGCGVLAWGRRGMWGGSRLWPHLVLPALAWTGSLVEHLLCPWPTERLWGAAGIKADRTWSSEVLPAALEALPRPRSGRHMGWEVRTGGCRRRGPAARGLSRGLPRGPCWMLPPGQVWWGATLEPLRCMWGAPPWAIHGEPHSGLCMGPPAEGSPAVLGPQWSWCRCLWLGCVRPGWASRGPVWGSGAQKHLLPPDSASS